MNKKWLNKNVLILGLGSYPQGSGSSALRYLHACGAKLIVSDIKSSKDLNPQLKRLKSLKGIRYIFGTHDLPLKGIDLIIKNPGVRVDHPLLRQAEKLNIPVETDISLFMREVENPIIGITGTRGKSTTTTLIHQLMRQKYPSAQMGGNIKVSPLTFIKKLSGKAGKRRVPVILELSSWQANIFKSIKRSPQVAVVTNIMIDHLNMYPSFGAYVADKRLIYKYQNSGDIVVLNKDNDRTFAMSRDAKSQVYFFSVKPLAVKERGAYVNSKGDIIFQDGLIRTKVLKSAELKLPGVHNLYNVLAAVTVAMTQGVSLTRIQSVLRKFKGIDSRLEMIREFKGIKFFNDTTATTPDATIAAIKSFDRAPILICGGTDKKLIFNDLADLINKKVKRLVLLPGTATEQLKKKLAIKRLKPVEVTSMREAIQSALKLAVKGDIILLSPGAASFGLFKNEFDRGEQFNKIVKNLK